MTEPAVSAGIDFWNWVPFDLFESQRTRNGSYAIINTYKFFVLFLFLF